MQNVSFFLGGGGGGGCLRKYAARTDCDVVLCERIYSSTRLCLYRHITTLKKKMKLYLPSDLIEAV